MKNAKSSKQRPQNKQEVLSTSLMEEHRNILTVAHVLWDHAQAVESGKKIDIKFFGAAVNFIRNYADKFHHAKEEDILFKELQKVELHCNPVDAMLYEHEQGRRLVKGLVDGLKSENKKKIAKNAKAYSMFIRDHIYKEDNVLYPMAEEGLSRTAQANILERFHKIDRTAKIMKYLAFVEKLERI